MDATPDAGILRVSRELAWAVTGAIRLAGPARPALVGIEHLVVSLALRTRPWRHGVGSRLSVLRRAAHASAADRTVDFPATGSVGDFEIDGLLREARWLETQPARGRQRPITPEWSVKVRQALQEAMVNAVGAGRPLCGVTDLTGVLLANRRLGAIDFLRQHRVEPSLPDLADEEFAWTPAVSSLRFYGLIGRARPPGWSRLLNHVLHTVDVYFAFEMEANRQAVRLGLPQVNGAHLLLTVASVAEQLRQTGVDPTDDPTGAGTAAAALRQCGLTVMPLLTAAAGAEQVDRPAVPRGRRFRWRAADKGPSWTVAAAAAADAARASDEPAAVALARAALTSDVAAQDLVRRCGRQPAEILAALAASPR